AAHDRAHVGTCDAGERAMRYCSPIPSENETIRRGIWFTRTQDSSRRRTDEMKQLTRREIARGRGDAQLLEQIPRAGQPRISPQCQPPSVEETAWIQRVPEQLDVAGRAPHHGRTSLDHQIDVSIGQANAVNDHRARAHATECIETSELLVRYLVGALG